MVENNKYEAIIDLLVTLSALQCCINLCCSTSYWRARQMVSIYPHWRGSAWYFPQLVVRGENLLAAYNVVENVLECTRMYENVWECRRMYAEKSWRVIMSPNDRVSTTWWRQTRPGTHQLLSERKYQEISHKRKPGNRLKPVTLEQEKVIYVALLIERLL